MQLHIKSAETIPDFLSALSDKIKELTPFDRPIPPYFIGRSSITLITYNHSGETVIDIISMRNDFTHYEYEMINRNDKLSVETIESFIKEIYDEDREEEE